MKKPVRSVALVACVAAFLPIVAATAQAKQQCSAAQGSHGSWWSYRIIDGRKCWYEGKPGLSKSLLEWRVKISPRARSHEELATTTPTATPPAAENPGNPMDAQAWAPTVSDTFEELWRTRVLSVGR